MAHHTHADIINRTLTKLCDLCDPIHDLLASKYDVDKDNPDTAERQLGYLAEDMEMDLDDQDLFEFWKSIRYTINNKIPDEC